MSPLAAAAAAAAASSKVSEETDTTGNDENASGAANTGQAMPSKASARQVKALCIPQPFLKAVAKIKGILCLLGVVFRVV